ncbi:MAG: hypothetical protein A2Y03_01205 [Omnitrophica WOR_2 bacterium GWF2_38_59]|nr:MAG: hypothetical protein A2Y06_04550 [Omnitrophica WOR_2 bacterium GWA2_37_7]OGX22927.1 MAG: hypothetical protein A2Y03_01205 [Omnitrophica WOR_2 bacterium GWF2_38_59]OGX49762.1 MAG: hypothetical protein A2243_11050 [Omnitrophica WOR_2 bacterium RIFOXYA2_FULL_38_17]OGX54101.1 MAG: hypothetical protein A2267_07815 [Omnitrophica WOR_2 bacterium RIFOXYA12_FULL_38_10]OGX55650.1 MAG: hypothetical protein A2447_11230 [Omnitrophica WOR_2 bacterium RIFOXYC2_FULL_38_12]OGX60094.1 MAG: hypothetical 
MQEEIIDQNNVSRDLLMAYFDKAYFQTSLDDKGSLFIQDKFRIFIDIGKKKANITLGVYFNLKEGCLFSDVLEYANTINKELIQIKAIAGEKVITIEYDIWIEGGALVKNVMASYRSFVSQVSASIGKDRNQVLL